LSCLWYGLGTSTRPNTSENNVHLPHASWNYPGRPGSCPTCGMDLVPMEPTESEDNKAFLDLWRKMKIAIVFTLPILSSRCQKWYLIIRY
jgi:hypothetical protein